MKKTTWKCAFLKNWTLSLGKGPQTLLFTIWNPYSQIPPVFLSQILKKEGGQNHILHPQMEHNNMIRPYKAGSRVPCGACLKLCLLYGARSVGELFGRTSPTQGSLGKIELLADPSSFLNLLPAHTVDWTIKLSSLFLRQICFNNIVSFWHIWLDVCHAKTNIIYKLTLYCF